MQCSHSNIFCASAFFTLPPTFIEQPAGSLPYLQETASDHRPVLNLLTNLWAGTFNPLNLELNPICHRLALLGAHHILHIGRIRVKGQVLCVPQPA